MSVESDRGAAGQASSNGKEHSMKAAKGLALVSATVAALVAGIVIGNSARKRFDRWTHGYK